MIHRYLCEDCTALAPSRSFGHSGQKFIVKYRLVAPRKLEKILVCVEHFLVTKNLGIENLNIVVVIHSGNKKFLK